MDGEILYDPVAGLSYREVIKDVPSVGAGEVGQDPADTDSGTVRDPVGADAQGGPVMDDLVPPTSHRCQVHIPNNP